MINDKTYDKLSGGEGDEVLVQGIIQAGSDAVTVAVEAVMAKDPTLTRGAALAYATAVLGYAVGIAICLGTPRANGRLNILHQNNCAITDFVHAVNAGAIVLTPLAEAAPANAG